MLLGELRAEIAAVCTGLAAAGLVVGTAGNVSARAGELIVALNVGRTKAAVPRAGTRWHQLD